MSRIEMSKRDRDVLKAMSLGLEGKRTHREASRLLRLSERQVRRIALGDWRRRGKVE